MMEKKMSRNAPSDLTIFGPLEDLARTNPTMLGMALANLDLLAGLAIHQGLPAEISRTQLSAQISKHLEFAKRYNERNLADFIMGYNGLKEMYKSGSSLSYFDISRLST